MQAVSIAEAQKMILTCAASFGSETVELSRAPGRMLTEEVNADRDYPPFNRSAMDGYAVKAEDLRAGGSLKVVYDLRAGDLFPGTLSPGSCVRIMTGAPVPAGADTVIRAEQSHPSGGEVRFSVTAPEPGSHIARQGEDASSGETLLRRGTAISPAVVALLATLGRDRVTVARLPRVRVFSTGNEVKPVTAGVAAHQIRDANGYALAALFGAWGIRVPYANPLEDDRGALEQAFREGLDADILVITGGVSAGAADFVPDVLRKLGVRPLFHRVRIKPGAPLWVGQARGDRPIVFALPGNPVSAQVGFKVFVEPYLRACLGMAPVRPFYYPLHLPRKRASALDEYFPAVVYAGGRGSRLQPVRGNGSGDIAVLSRCAGLGLHPGVREWLEEDEPVPFFPWDPWLQPG